MKQPYAPAPSAPRPPWPTNGAVFRVADRPYRCILTISTTQGVALYECQSCATVTTDPRRHGQDCGAPRPRRVRGMGVAVTIPLPGRPA